MLLDEHVEHGSVFVNGSPEPMGYAAHNHVHLIQMPPGTPPGFPVAQVLGELAAEIDAPGANGFARHFDAPLEQQLFDIPVTQSIPMVKPDGLTDDRKRESVPWKLLVGQHGVTLHQQLARTPIGTSR